MDDQTKVSGDGSNGKSNGNGSGDSVVGSIAGFGNDVATLAELQLRLASLDFKETTSRALIPLGLVLVGLVTILGSVPVALGGLAYLIAQLFSISLGWALVATAGLTMLVAGLVVVFAGRRFAASLESFRRSRDELVRNVSWIRTVLVHSGRPVPKRRW